MPYYEPTATGDPEKGTGDRAHMFPCTCFRKHGERHGESRGGGHGESRGGRHGESRGGAVRVVERASERKKERERERESEKDTKRAWDTASKGCKEQRL